MVGMKILVTGVVFTMFAAAAALGQPFLIVGCILAALGCILLWLDR